SLDPFETNDASVLRFSLHQSGGKFKSLIGRFRISYTEDDRIRQLLLPAQPRLWSSVGPFPADDVVKAYKTAFEPEKDIHSEPLDLKKSYTQVVLPPAQPAKPPGGPAAAKPMPQKAGEGTPKPAMAKEALAVDGA